MKRAFSVLAGLVLLGSSYPGWVHHSGAMFDRATTQVVSGTVVEFNWTNPHASFKVEVVAASGQREIWAIEMNSPNNLVREGWKRTTIKPGDKVSVTVNPLRDGRPGGWYLSIALPDGRHLGSSASAPATTPDAQAPRA